jgi:hypothetical protein
MVRRVLTLGTGLVVLALAAALVMGSALPVSAFAAAKHRPVVSAVSPATGTVSGGNVVVITGKNFQVNGKSVVKKVIFDTKRATRVSVTSATSLTATVPAGKSRVNVRVVTKAGKSARVSGDKYTYYVATQIAVNAGDGQSASAGTVLTTAPSVIVRDAAWRPVAGVVVTFAVATGGGSVTDATAMTDASGIAKVGSWKLGGAAGSNTLTATSAGLTGSPVTFTATGSAGVLQVQHNGTPVRAYSLDELKALTPFVGWAGLFKNPAIGPDAVTGVKVTDIVKDALGAAMTTAQSVEITNLAPPKAPFTRTLTYDQLVSFTYPAEAMYDATTRALVPSPVGPLASILMYSDPAGLVMPVASGPLRFIVADATSENLVMNPPGISVSTVNQLNVINP